MTAPTLSLVVPMPPNLPNARMHHIVKANIRVGYYAVLDALLLGRFTFTDVRKIAAYAEGGGRKAPLYLQRECSRVVDWLQSRGAPIALPSAPLTRMSIASVMYLGAHMDQGNAVGRHKWVEDWLVTRGVLATDTERDLQWLGMPRQIVKRSERYRIELTLTPQVGDDAR